MLFFVYDAVLRSKTAFLYTLYPVSLTGTALCNAAFTYIYITYLPYGAEMKDTKFIGVLFFYEREDFVMTKKIVIGEAKITLIGTKSQIEKTEKLLNVVHINGYEKSDRLNIQQALDCSSGNAVVLYEGNTVYPSKALVNEFKRMKKSGSIEKMSNKMYEFMNLNFDIAHYNKAGYINEYNGSFVEMYDATAASMRTTPLWKSDVRNILMLSGLI